VQVRTQFLLNLEIVAVFNTYAHRRPVLQRQRFCTEYRRDRSSGQSTVAALIALLHTVHSKLSTNDYVHVFTLDFTKAFDTVRHATMMAKMSHLSLPDQVFNWIGDFFQGHWHCTKFNRKVSELAEIFASVIQGSGLGPAAFLVTAADLCPVHDGNDILKYADDTYLVIPAANTHTQVLPNLHTSKPGPRPTTCS